MQNTSWPGKKIVHPASIGSIQHLQRHTYSDYTFPTTANSGSRHSQMSSSPSSVQFSFRTTSHLRERKVFSIRFSNRSMTNTSLYVHFLTTPPRHCSRYYKPMAVSNSKSRVRSSQPKNFLMERCVVVRLVLQGLDLPDEFL